MANKKEDYFTGQYPDEEYYWYELVYNKGTSKYISKEYKGGIFSTEKDAKESANKRMKRHKDYIEKKVGDIYQPPTNVIIHYVSKTFNDMDDCLKDQERKKNNAK